MKTSLTLCVCLCAASVALTRAAPLTRNKRRINVAVPAPGLQGPQLVDVLIRTPDILYHDFNKKLTALKSSKFKACFIRDLDPDFWPVEAELQRATMEHVPEVLLSPSDELKFQERVGPYIGPMCRDEFHYYMNRPAPAPPSAHVAPGAPPSPGHTPAAPPPLSLYLASGSGQAPPPHNPQTENPTPPPVKAASEGTPQNEPAAPPPVHIFRAQQAAAPTQRPPPLSLWQSQ